MAHNISGIITSFPYSGPHPHVVLVGNFHFIPVERRRQKGYWEDALPPFDELTTGGRKLVRELSFKGKCAYIETDYFGGEGTQLAAVWENGQQISGPLFSQDFSHPGEAPAGTEEVENAINTALKLLGIYCHEGKDEFDSVRLGHYRGNGAFREEYNSNPSE